MALKKRTKKYIEKKAAIKKTLAKKVSKETSSEEGSEKNITDGPKQAAGEIKNPEIALQLDAENKIADAEASSVTEEANRTSSEEKDINDEESETGTESDCMCLEEDGEYFCYKLRQGRWIQWSAIGYPTKKICESVCRNSN